MDIFLLKGIYDKRFLSDAYFVELVPREIREWFLGTAVNYWQKLQSEKEKVMLLHKFTHCKKVFSAGLEIMEAGRDDISWNKSQGALVCFLHDVGRLYQATQGTFNDLKVDHAEAGAKLFKNKGFLLPAEFNCDEEIIADSIFNHNKQTYEGSNIYAKLTRDADKIEIFREFKLQERFAKREYPDGPLNEDILNDFLNHRLSDYHKMKTRADFLLIYAAWFWDLNFKASRQIARREGFANLIRDGILKFGIGAAEGQKVNQALSQFEASVPLHPPAI